MGKLLVELPDSLQKSIAALAKKEGYSVDQFLATAAAEKMAAIRTVDYLRREAASGRRVDFDRFLATVPEREVAESDAVPNQGTANE